MTTTALMITIIRAIGVLLRSSAPMRIGFLSIVLGVGLAGVIHVAHCPHHEVHPQRAREERQGAEDGSAGRRRSVPTPEQRNRQQEEERSAPARSTFQIVLPAPLSSRWQRARTGRGFCPRRGVHSRVSYASDELFGVHFGAELLAESFNRRHIVPHCETAV